MQTAFDIETSIHDSLALERCKTEGELHYVVRNIEARHKVEGASPHTLDLWEREKVRHIHRVLGVVRA